MYSEDNNGNLSLSFDWVGGELNYNANNSDNTNLSYLINGQLGPYVKNPAVYKCPADQSQAVEGGVKLPRVRTYSMSQAFAQPDEGWVPTAYRHYLRLADMDLPRPANLWVFIDESPDGVNDGAFAVNMTPYGGIWQDGPGNYHEGACGFSFADGHSEIHKWTDARTLGMNITYAPSFPYQPVEISMY
jgi:prepilin-type processing-associated H-X9-DG protein